MYCIFARSVNKPKEIQIYSTGRAGMSLGP